MAYNFDTTSYPGADNDLYYDTLFDPDWTLDRATYSFNGAFVPDEYWKGNLAKSWEWTDPTTLVVKINQGIHWQNKAPVNGRELVASDIQAHYDRVMVPETSPMFTGAFGNWDKVTALDNYTVQFKFKTASAQNFQSVTSRSAYNMIEAPEYVALAKTNAEGNPLQDWKNAVGTSPWILSDVLTGSSMTFTKNPDYWGVDTRHPEYTLPYADELKILILADISARVAAIKVGKLDILKELDWKQTLNLTKSNTSLQTGKVPAGTTGLQFRLDKSPFTDINVRKAMNMAVNRSDIANSFYGGTAQPYPAGLITASYNSYAYTYNEWPQSLKDEYSYNAAQAKELLTQAGYPKGFDTSVDASNTDDLELLQILKSEFNDIGIRMNINAMDSTTYEAYRRSGKVEQMVTRGQAQNFPPDRIIDFYYSKGSDQAMSGIMDANYDALRDKFYAATTAADAAAAFKSADKYVIENHYMVFMPETSTYNIWQPRIKGYSGEFLQWGMGMTFAHLWISE